MAQTYTSGMEHGVLKQMHHMCVCTCTHTSVLKYTKFLYIHKSLSKQWRKTATLTNDFGKIGLHFEKNDYTKINSIQI